jgi:hypothetical protein
MPSNVFVEDHFNILLLRLGFRSGLFPSGFPTKTHHTSFFLSIGADYTVPLCMLLARYFTRQLDSE